MKPTIQQLIDFASPYFDTSPPTIEYDANIDSLGQAIKKKHQILINPKIPVNCLGCDIGRERYFYQPQTKLTLEEGEQYFLTLLHEIEHFKEPWQPPAEWLQFKREIELNDPDDLEMQLYNAETYIQREEGEEKADYLGRIGDFQNWLLEDGYSQHAAVEDWAIEEFLRRRDEIRHLISDRG